MSKVQSFGPGIWTATAPFTALGMDFRNHMTVVALPHGNLWLHSVIPLTPELEQEIRTLILTDLAFNFGTETVGRTRFALRLYGAYGHFGPSRLIRLLIRDKSAFSASLERILAEDFDRIIVSHGTPLLEDGKQRFSDAFARYGRF